MYEVFCRIRQKQNIIIYDIKLATISRSLEGLQSPVLALQYNRLGNKLASYIGENSPFVKIWKLDDASFFSQVLGYAGPAVQIINLEAIPSSMEAIMLNVKLEWLDENKLHLVRENASELYFDVTI